MSDRVRPIGNKVLVRRDPEEALSAGGLALPDRSKEKPRRGTVLRLGSGRRVKDPHPDYKVDRVFEYSGPGPWADFQVQPGDVVYFNRYGGHEIDPKDVDGEKGLLLISEGEILAYTREEE